MSRSGVVVVILCNTVLFVVLVIPVAPNRTKASAKKLKDATHIKQIFQSWAVFAREHDGIFPTPGLMRRLPDPLLGERHPERGPEDVTQNTTANLYSMIIMQNYLGPDTVVGPTEPSDFVSIHENYVFELYEPSNSIWWDPSFSADLEEQSHVSYAHLPLFGEAKQQQWRESNDPKFVLIGNRGPLNGDESLDSITKKIHEPHTQWSGNLGFADGTVSLFDSLAEAAKSCGNPYASRGDIGQHPIVTFTKEMTEDGPVIQHD